MKQFIPIQINVSFFITAAIIGFINSFTLFGTLIWIGIIFISVLVHEFGHALTAKMFGQSPRIELVAFGGLTIPEGPKLKPWKEFIMIFMGPCFGFILFIAASVLLQFPIANPAIREVIGYFRSVNLFWTFINLLPILPLDGGQLIRVLLESFLGSKAWRISLAISVCVSILFATAFFLIGLYLIGAFFLLFAFQNIESFRKMQNFSEADQMEENRELLRQIESLLSANRFDEAVPRLHSLIEKTGQGLIYTLACEYLAKIYYDHGQYKQTYDTLLPIEKNLSKEALCLLYSTAFEVGDYKKVISLSGHCFEERKTIDVALRAAASSAILKDFNGAIEWLKTVKSFGNIDLVSLTQDHAFDSIRGESAFKALFH